MAKVPLSKIRVTGLHKHYKVLIQELHKRGLMEIDQNPEFEASSIKLERPACFDAFDLARIDFAIDYLASYAPKKGKLENMLTSGKVILSEKEARVRFEAFAPRINDIISECEEAQDFFVRSKNELVLVENQIKEIEPFQSLNMAVNTNLNTEETTTVLARVPETKKTAFIEQLARLSNLADIKIFHETGVQSYFRLTFINELRKSVEEAFNEFDVKTIDLSGDFGEAYAGRLPREIQKKLKEKCVDINSQIEEREKHLHQLGKNWDDLRIAHDFSSWKKDKNDVQANVLQTSYIFAFEGWIPVGKLDALQHWIKQVFLGDVSVDIVEKSEEEKVPSLLKNRIGISSFTSMTQMFGAPAGDDIDPTPAIAPFFVIFFGICLSDTGYGLLIALASAFFLLFGTFSKEARKTLLMGLMCGISAFLGGILLGGHFGMTLQEAPAFLTTTNAAGELAFRGQILDPLSGSGTMTFLIFTFIVGYLQVLVGLCMRIVKGVANKDWGLAICDGFGWLYTLVLLALWVMSTKQIILAEQQQVLIWMLLGGVGFLVLTLGRAKKNPILKIVFGILGLYGAMDFVSNILSYSRLMALGLATGIIGAAMNMTAHVLNDMVPGIFGILIMIAFMVFGHSINFGLSGLGAYVHSLRLQFIEFFGIFYAGGGRLFRPFARAKKYLLFRS